ncbi:hypothetical protein C8N36_1035 [Pelagimonas varians]|uniref:Uncharacterized protein n=1 Tax=Pelagimonas varians TaxID=696760 RepID=A0A238KHS5_9RHOB|nr:hypothetical protein C8N36_1035 [Pelagimonas varians]SMX42144.1 hypothetical protein PEV8663_02425 [Pelagimonas varians]
MRLIANRLAFTFILVCALTGCFDGEFGDSLVQKVRIDYRTDSQPSCGCGQSVYLVNRSAEKSIVEVGIVSSGGGSPRKDRTIIRTLHAGGETFIGCTANTPPSAPILSNSCSYRSIYRIKNQRKASIRNLFRPRIVTVASTDTDQLNFSSTNSSYRGILPNCIDECSSGNSSNAACLNLQNVQSDVMGQIDWLATSLSELAPSAGAVSKASIMEKFGVANDPCERSDTVVDGATLKNRGIACRLDSRLSSPRGPLISTIHMGPTVFANLSVNEDNSVTAVFRDGSVAVSFSDRILHQVFGGEILEISSGSFGVIATTPSGCISLRHQDI